MKYMVIKETPEDEEFLDRAKAAGSDWQTRAGTLLGCLVSRVTDRIADFEIRKLAAIHEQDEKEIAKVIDIYSPPGIG